MEPTFVISNKLQIWSGDSAGAWHFVIINKTIAKHIKQLYDGPRRGFGAVKVLATIGATSWKTSIFPTKEGTYFFPIKAPVRKSEHLVVDKKITATITLL